MSLTLPSIKVIFYYKRLKYLFQIEVSVKRNNYRKRKSQEKVTLKCVLFYYCVLVFHYLILCSCPFVCLFLCLYLCRCICDSICYCQCGHNIVREHGGYFKVGLQYSARISLLILKLRNSKQMFFFRSKSLFQGSAVERGNKTFKYG